jgi:hypothetical protein
MISVIPSIWHIGRTAYLGKQIVDIELWRNRQRQLLEAQR